MLIKLQDGRVKDAPMTEVTAENYICPVNETHLYHCIVEVRKFNPETGARLSVPRLQKFGKRIFEGAVRKNLEKQGYTITILHRAGDPIKEDKPAEKPADEKPAKGKGGKKADKPAEATEKPADEPNA